METEHHVVLTSVLGGCDQFATCSTFLTLEIEEAWLDPRVGLSQKRKLLRMSEMEPQLSCS
jgi:hypothetical protein